ncbi:MAG: hypothetical protein QM715_20935 [Nibricoccus sp.]
MPHLAKPRTRLPQLERETPLVAIAAARQVLEEVSRYLDDPLPTRYAARLAHRARAIYANSASFRARIKASGDTGRDWLYLYMRHWFAAILKADCPALYDQLPSSFSVGEPLPKSRYLSPDIHQLVG